MNTAGSTLINLTSVKALALPFAIALALVVNPVATVDAQRKPAAGESTHFAHHQQHQVGDPHHHRRDEVGGRADTGIPGGHRATGDPDGEQG